MGTKSETVIWDGDTMIVLYKHWDGYPDHMIQVFREVADFASYMAVDQLHWLSYTEVVASFTITYYGLLSKELRDKYRWPLNPDFRPCGKTADFVEFVYVLDLSKTKTKGRWILKIYEVNPSFWKLSRRKRDSIYRKIVKGDVVPEDYLKQVGFEEIPVRPSWAKPEIETLVRELQERLKSLMGALID
jgi:hypothetical protein